MKYKVREAKHSDIAKLTELRVKQLEERVTDLKPEVALSTMRHLTDELGSRVRAWVAELDGEVIGCAFVDVNHGMPRPSNPSGVYGELLGAYILPEQLKIRRQSRHRAGVVFDRSHLLQSSVDNHLPRLFKLTSLPGRFL